MNKKNLTDKVFGRLTVIMEKTSRMWECKCECGNKVIVFSEYLQSGRKKSCGCLKKEGNNYKHGQNIKGHTTPEYRAWAEMIKRCRGKNIRAIKDYYSRGITVCDRWLNSFENFFEDMGERPSFEYSLDRYPNNDGNYEPTNCRWATIEQQSRNKRNNIWITYNDETLVLNDWSKKLGIHHSTIKNLYVNKKLSIGQIMERYKIAI